MNLSLSFLEPILLPFIKQICLWTPQIDDLRTTIPIFLLYGTFLAIVCIRHPGTTTNYTTSLVRPVITFITYSYQRAWTYIRITNNTFPIIFFAESTNCNTRLFTTEDEIRVMFRHVCVLTVVGDGGGCWYVWVWVIFVWRNICLCDLKHIWRIL